MGSAMSKSDEYRKNADECRRMASQTQKPEDEAAWLRLACSWLQMLEGHEASRQPSSPANKTESSAPAQNKRDWPAPGRSDNRSSH
jgi:hypothetical protein